MRLKSGIWVAAYLRRYQVEGVAAVVRRRRAEEGGGRLIKVDTRDGEAGSYGSAPPTDFDEARPSERIFNLALASKPEPDIEAYLARQVRYDPDLWIVEVEDRAGRHFLDHIVR